MLFSGTQSDFLFELDRRKEGIYDPPFLRFFAVIHCTPILLAQGDRGSIAGLVSDPSGGVIPGVTIEAVNQATNLNPNFSKAFNQGWTQPNGGKIRLRRLQFDLFPTVMFGTEGYTRYGDDIASDNYFNTATLLDSITLVRRNHTFKFGGEIQHHQDNYRNFGNGGGTFTFRRESTGLPGRLPGAPISGDSWASFLLGEAYSGSAFFRASLPGGRYDNIGFFVDDTWKVAPKLTLTMGFRWEIVIPHDDPLGRVSYMDITKPNTAAGNLPGAMVYGGKEGFGNRFLDILWWNPAPRLGLAYRMNDKTVIRAGAGIFNSNYINQGLGLPSFGFSTTASFA